MNELHISASANIALIKYWGKADTKGNVPAVGSISAGLDGVETRTTMAIGEGPCDQITINGKDHGEGVSRAGRFLDRVREAFGRRECFVVASNNNFPTGAGLASSASGFAALALGADRLLQLALEPTAVSALARLGSGSAARSVYGGYVEMSAGDDAGARQIAAADDWPLEVVIALTSTEVKSTGSTEGMELTRRTSPYYDSWVKSHDADMETARTAIAQKDFEKLAMVSEQSCLKMHGTMMTASPGLIYWNGATVEVMHQVRQLRDTGWPVFFTIDAGAQVKVFCQVGYSARLREALHAVPGVVDTIASRVGGEPRIEGGDT